MLIVAPTFRLIPQLMNQQYTDQFPEGVLDWLHNRGLKDETIEKYGLSWKNNYILIPIGNRDGDFVFYKKRYDPRIENLKEKGIAKYRYTKGGHATLYGWIHVTEGHSPIILVEGELDRILLEQEGFNAIATTGGAYDWKKPWLEKMKEVYVAFDADDAGRKATKKVARMKSSAKIIKLPELNDKTDITDVINKKGVEFFTKLMEEAKPMDLPQEGSKRYWQRRKKKAKSVPFSDLIPKLQGSNERNIKCPLHDDKEPSFHWHQDTNTVRCYGACDKGWDTIEWLRDTKNMSFKEAVKRLTPFWDDPPSQREQPQEMNLNSQPGTFFLDREVSFDSFVIEPLIVEGELNILVGAPGQGKSLFALKIANDVAKGEYLFGRFKVKEEKKIGYVDLEMGVEAITRRYHSFVDRKAAENINVIFHERIQVTDRSKFDALKKWVRENNIELLIVDTFVSFHGAKREGANAEMEKINNALLEMIREKQDLTIFYTHHEPKPSGEFEREGWTVARGASEIMAKPAAGMRIQSRDSELTDNKTIFRITQIKKREAKGFKPFKVYCQYDKENNESEWGFQGEGYGEGSKNREVKTWAFETIKKKQKLTRKELIELAQKEEMKITEYEIKRATRELEEVSEIKSERKGRGAAKHYFVPGRVR